MPRKPANKYRCEGNPPVNVHIFKHGREGKASGAMWHYQFYFGKDDAGKPKRYRGSTGKIDHDEAMQQAIAAVDAVRAAKAHPAGGLTLSVAINDCLATRFPNGENETDNRSYRDARNRLDAFAKSMDGTTTIGAMSVNEMKRFVQEHINKLKAAKLSARTVHNHRVIISRFCSWLIGNGKVSWIQNPAFTSYKKKLGIDASQPVQDTKAAPSDSVAVKALDAAWDNGAFPAVVLVLSGLRPVGVSRLTWNSLDLTAGHVRTVEKAKPRVISIGDWAREQLSAWRHTHAEFADTDAVVSSHSWLYKMMRAVKKSAGMPRGEGLYAFRRYFFNKHYSAGTSVQEASELGGNSVPTAMRYYNKARIASTKAANVIGFPVPQSLTNSLTGKAENSKIS